MENRFSHAVLHRIAALILSLCVALALCLSLAPAASADSGDLDEIQNYTIDVTPNTDGSLSIVVSIDWLVLDSSSEGPLEWVQVGIPNKAAADFVALTSSISRVERDGSYARIDFDHAYYEGETVSFSYSWTQPYMFTQDDNGYIHYSYTPGWFESANIDQMTLNWHENGTMANQISFPDADSATDFTDANGETCHSAVCANMAHGQKMTANLMYASWPAELDLGMAADQYSGSSVDSSVDSDVITITIIIFFLVFSFMLLMVLSSLLSWVGGFADRRRPHYISHGGYYYACDYHGHVSRGSPRLAAPPPGAVHYTPHMGGGHSYGGGGGRSGGGHSCACASSCACACACAGGGRAGCSAKNLYGAIHLPEHAEKAPDQKDS